MPSLFKLLLSFAAILLLNRLGLPLALALLSGGALLGVWAGMAPGAVAETMARAAVQRETAYLLLIVLLILYLSRLLEAAGALRGAVEAFRGVIPDRRLSSALLPALVGFLPLPGGALLSAPMVEQASAGAGLPGERKAVINYWFRHVWEYWWPLYPGFVLAVGLLEVPLGLFIAVQFPLTVFAVLAGAAFLLRREHFNEAGGEAGRRGGGWGRLLFEARPILALVSALAAFSLARRLLPAGAVPPELPMLAGLLFGILAAILDRRLPRSAVFGALRDRRFVSFAGLVLAVMALRAVLREGGLAFTVKDELTAAGVPPLLVIALLPFVSGLITGIAFGYVGVSFPIVVPLLQGGGQLALLAGGSLAFFCGYLGMILSPIHVCFVFSKDYFRAGFPSCFRLLLPPAGILALLAGAYYGILFLAAG